MGIEISKNLLEQIRSAGVKMIGFQNEQVVHIEFFPTTPEVQASALPPALDMPPDDVMLFAATEDPDELMKSRKHE